ncbi:hypothetical protein L7F22_024877 [Adiantum nelumboides]|nr:hypothetical protein [Adiantum nelumboides]
MAKACWRGQPPTASRSRFETLDPKPVSTFQIGAVALRCWDKLAGAGGRIARRSSLKGTLHRASKGESKELTERERERERELTGPRRASQRLAGADRGKERELRLEVPWERTIAKINHK